jgi:hypothetical protein
MPTSPTQFSYPTGNRRPIRDVQFAPQFILTAWRGAWSALVLAAVGAALTPSATAGVFTLDFQTPATGSSVTNGTVLNSPLGAITFTGNYSVTQGVELFSNSQPSSDKVLIFNDNSGFVYIQFGFAVDSISGMWGDRVGGTMQIEGLDINNNIVGYFFYAGGGRQLGPVLVQSVSRHL